MLREALFFLFWICCVDKFYAYMAGLESACMELMQFPIQAYDV